MAATKTEVVVLKIRRQWQGMELRTDRRRHRRFDTTALTARAAMIGTGDAGLELQTCTLLDLSYGGMSFTTEVGLAPETEYRFVLDLGAPFCDLVLVKARIVWVANQDGERFRAGARFVESSKGWLASDAESFE